MRRVALFAAVFGVATILAAGSRATAHAAPISSSSNDRVVTVQPGDYLSKLGKEYGTTAKRLFDANPKISNPDLIYPGERLRVPGANEQLTPRPYGTMASSTPITTTAASAIQASATVATSAATSSVWTQLANCESSGNWSINTGNGFYGGLQFTISSWQAVGGSGYPNQNSENEQIYRAEKLLAVQGWGAWPACSAKLGL